MKYLKELCLLPGVSSFEEPVAEYIAEKARPFADSIETDGLGNLIITKKGKKKGAKSLMLTAHMDEVGFIVRTVEDDGYIHFAPVGGIDPRIALGRKVLVGKRLVPGVIGLKAVHLTTPAERKKVPKFDDMYIDIGATSRKDAERNVRQGDRIVFDSDYVEFGEKMVKAKAIDDRFGCAVMLNLIEKELPQDVTFVFSVQEEVGTRGAFGAAFRVKPDISLVLEGTTSADIPTVDDDRKVTRIGEGPVLGCMDRSTIYDPKLLQMSRDLADENGIPWQIKQFVSGGTDASAIQRSREGVRVASISAPVRYLHAASTVASMEDMENALQLAELFIQAVSDGKAGK